LALSSRHWPGPRCHHLPSAARRALPSRLQPWTPAELETSGTRAETAPEAC
jgi:hypothetical protein